MKVPLVTAALAGAVVALVVLTGWEYTEAQAARSEANAAGAEVTQLRDSAARLAERGDDPLAAAVRWIEVEVDGRLYDWLPEHMARDPSLAEQYRAYTEALSAMNYIQGHMSPARYRGFARDGIAPTTTRQCLVLAAGICGNQTQAMIEVVQAIGRPVRSVGLYYLDEAGVRQNHSGVEIEWGGRWRYIDVTYGAVFRRPGTESHELLSLAEVLAEPDPRRLAIANAADLEYQWTTQFIGNPLNYLSRNPDVITAGEGTVHLVADQQGGVTQYDLRDVPQYVGQAPGPANELGNLRLALPVPQPLDNLRVTVRASACANGTLHARSTLGNWNLPLRPTLSGLVTLPVKADKGWIELTMSDMPPDSPCYVVITAVEAE